jgi:hypothetical protein
VIVLVGEVITLINLIMNRVLYLELLANKESYEIVPFLVGNYRLCSSRAVV